MYDLDDLFRREGGWYTRAWGIGEHLCDARLQPRVVVVHHVEVGLGSHPAPAPASNGGGGAAEARSKRFIPLAGSGQDDGAAAGERLRTGRLAQQAFQDRTLARRDRDGNREWARHDPSL
ncbi:MAG TPA: hypothetical protein VLA19_25950, partial [Herpetosiphonaceae bacterium]|nr:hypothetical protein [Herpetosiphonaceae bacterium]